MARTPTAKETADAYEASDALHTAADLIRAASNLLDRLPAAHMPALHQIVEAEQIDTGLADALAKLGDRISLEVDYAAEDAA